MTRRLICPSHPFKILPKMLQKPEGSQRDPKKWTRVGIQEGKTKKVGNLIMGKALKEASILRQDPKELPRMLKEVGGVTSEDQLQWTTKVQVRQRFNAMPWYQSLHSSPKDEQLRTQKPHPRWLKINLRQAFRLPNLGLSQSKEVRPGKAIM